MSEESLKIRRNTWKIAGAAVVGAASGLVGTTFLLRSFEAGILAAIGGAIALMIAAVMTVEQAEV